MQNLLEGFKGRFKQEEERISELEDKAMEIIQAEEQKYKRVKKNRQNLKDLWDNMK